MLQGLPELWNVSGKNSNILDNFLSGQINHYVIKSGIMSWIAFVLSFEVRRVKKEKIFKNIWSYRVFLATALATETPYFIYFAWSRKVFYSVWLFSFFFLLLLILVSSAIVRWCEMFWHFTKDIIKIRFLCIVRVSVSVWMQPASFSCSFFSSRSWLLSILINSSSRLRVFVYNLKWIFAPSCLRKLKYTNRRRTLTTRPDNDYRSTEI